jgi:hypothetical protein
MAENPKKPATEDELQALWHKCDVLVEESTSHATHHREQGAVLLRWVVTTCLTLNVGALVATMNAVDFNMRSRFYAGIWFLGGTLLALIASATLASAFLKIAANSSLIAAETKIALRQKNFERLNALNAAGFKSAEARGGVAVFLSMLTVLAFLIGAFIMIEGAP